MNKIEYKHYREQRRVVIHDYNRSFDTYVLPENLSIRRFMPSSFESPLNGVINKDDFGMASEFVKSLLCYKNNQYYIARDPEESTMIIFASKKQYLKAKALQLKTKKLLSYCVKEIVKTNASLHRLLKQAMDYNTYAKFLKRIKNDTVLLSFCKHLMSFSGNIEIRKEDIQKCYDLDIPPSSYGSGRRYAVSSCMRHHKVGKFYDNFNVEGYMVSRLGRDIGRFLVWTMANGKRYVDRLYVTGEYAEEALNVIDEMFKDAEKYPQLPSSWINAKDELDFSRVAFPYIDTFSRWVVNEDNAKEMFLVREVKPEREPGSCYEEQGMHSTSPTLRSPIIRCKRCGALLTSSANKNTLHTILCEKNLKGKRLEKVKKLNEIVKNFKKDLEDAENEEQAIW